MDFFHFNNFQYLSFFLLLLHGSCLSKAFVVEAEITNSLASDNDATTGETNAPSKVVIQYMFTPVHTLNNSLVFSF